MMSDNVIPYRFTQDWFKWAEDTWPSLIPMLPARKAFLEIGSYEGRSSVWIIENMIEDGGELVCIDTWEGGEEHATIGEKMNVVENNFDHNIVVVTKKFPERKIVKYKNASYEGLKPIPVNWCDFIYIDGSHQAKDVLTDACMAWPLLKVGGIMVFDDYMWGNPRDALHRPKPAIDAFTGIFAEEIDFLHLGYQLAIRKAK